MTAYWLDEQGRMFMYEGGPMALQLTTMPWWEACQRAVLRDLQLDGRHTMLRGDRWVRWFTVKVDQEEEICRECRNLEPMCICPDV